MSASGAALFCLTLASCGGHSVGVIEVVGGSSGETSSPTSGSSGIANESNGGTGGTGARGGSSGGVTETSGGSSVGGSSPAGGTVQSAGGSAGSGADGGSGVAGSPTTDLEAGWPDPPPDPASEALAYQISARHDGWQPNDQLALPLVEQWAHDFDGADISYPLVADGRVFVTTAGKGSNLYALSEDTGDLLWGPVALGGSFGWSNATYELGRVFSVNSDGIMQAFDAGSGQILWAKQLPGQYLFSSPPTAANRRVFVGGAGEGGTLYALAGNTGQVLWTASVENGDSSSPVVTDDAVFVSYACVQAYSFATVSGAALWHHDGGCEGGGGDTPALLGNRLYARDFVSSDLMFDAPTGELLGAFASSAIPAGTDSTVFTVSGGVLAATPYDGTTPIWTYGDGKITSAPVVVGNQVVVGSSVGEEFDPMMTGKLDVLSASSGEVVSSFALPAPVPTPDEFDVSGPVTGLAAADNRLFVPAGGVLYAF